MMRRIRLLAVLCALLLSAPALELGAQNRTAPQPQAPAQDEFVPIDQLPPEAELPAAPMVIAAYVFVWAAFIAYMFTLIRRVRKVEADLSALERARR